MSNSLDSLAARTAQKITQAVITNVTKKLEQLEQKQPNGENSLIEEGKREKRKDLTKREAADLENMATKALGVLQENGVYAGLLFLYARNEDYARRLRENLLQSLADEPIKKLGLMLPEEKKIENWMDVGPHLTDKICSDLDTLLLVKQLWEQTLIYARYGAKALEEK